MQGSRQDAPTSAGSPSHREAREAPPGLVAILGLLVGGCQVAHSAGAAEQVVSMQWELTAIESPSGELVPAAEGQPVLVFHAPERDGDECAGRVSGDGGCNRFWGEYRLLDHQNLAFSAIASTRMACTAERLILEHAMLEALSGAVMYEVDGRVLTIRAGETVLYFDAAEAAPAPTGADAEESLEGVAVTFRKDRPQDSRP